MESKRRRIEAVAVVCAETLLASALAAPAGAACDPAYVETAGLVVSVAATGGDDTANLQCALDQAVALGAGASLQLQAGEYRTAQLVATDLRGTIRGAGSRVTVVRNPDGTMPMLDPHGWYLAPPSAANTYPALLTLHDGDVLLTDLAIRIGGLDVLGPFYSSILGVEYGPSPGFLLAGVIAYGSNARFRFNRVAIAGASACFGEPGENLRVDLMFGMLYGPPWSSAATLEVADSEFGSCQGVGVFAQDGARIRVASSHFATWYDFFVADIRNSQVEASRNTFDGVIAGFDAWGGEAAGSGVRDSSILVRNNKFSGLFGVLLEDNWVTGDTEPTFSGSIACAIVGNNVASVSPDGAGYAFLPGTYGCTVVGNGGTAMDLTGGLHTITGVTPHTGLGPSIAPLLRRWR